MTRIVVYKPPSQGALGEEAAVAWADLARQLRALGHDAIRQDAYMEPGRRGVVFGEVVLIYLGMKAIDTVTDHVMKAALERIIEVAKAWGRERFKERRDAPRPRPMSISFYDKDGRLIRSWKIQQSGEEENIPGDDQQPAARVPVELEGQSRPSETSASDIVAEDRTPDVSVLLTPAHEGTHLRADAFVGDDQHASADITHLPAHFVVMPSPDRAVLFRLEEAENEMGVVLTATGWRCEMIEVEHSGAVLVLCYADH